jgi:hypothetical protein
MKKFFVVLLTYAMVASGNAWSACQHTDNEPAAGAGRHTIFAAALFCGDSAIGFRRASFVVGPPQRDDIAFVAFAALLQSQLPAERRNH